MIYGYARVSSAGQATDGNSLVVQERELRGAGATVIYKDAFTGTKGSRPELDKLLSVLQEGDTLVATKLDRIARSVRVGYDLVESLLKRGVRVYIMNMGVMDNTPSGKLTRNIFLSFAEYERDMIEERTREGKRIKRETDPNYREGRKRVPFDREKMLELKPVVERGEMTVSEACRLVGISRSKWYREVNNVCQ